MRRILALLALSGLTFLIVDDSLAQQQCPTVPPRAAFSDTNIFGPQQETDLGDLISEQTESRYKVIDQSALTDHLQSIAASLAVYLPQTGLRFQVLLIDAPFIDAFSVPGGRIYLTRKMVGFLRDDDETAGLLGHEMGHIVSHQQAIHFSALLRQALRVYQVSSREDVARKYNQLLDNAARRPGIFRELAKSSEPDQHVADQIAIYVAAAAGYSPQAMADFFDRLAQTHGRTGNSFSDFFGLTPPDERRLGLIKKAIASLPVDCSKSALGTVTAAFQKWQSDVIAYSGPSRKEALPGLVTKHKLNPPLRANILNLRFSPDGQYVLAQDDSSIFVLTRQPLIPLFRIDAPNAHPAKFTPDSKNIVLSTPALRVENWNIADQKRVSVNELALQEPCTQSLLSPDGTIMACLLLRETSMRLAYLDLLVLDVSTGDILFAQREFLKPTILNSDVLTEALSAGGLQFPMAFSPSDEYFSAASFDKSLALDCKTWKPLALAGALNESLKRGFRFVSANRIIAANPSDRQKSEILDFPSGNVSQTLSYGFRGVDVTSHGDYALLRQTQDGEMVAIIDLTTGKKVSEVRQAAAIDVFDKQILATAITGEIGLLDLTSLQAQSHVALPEVSPARLSAGAVSADFHWLAASNASRSAVWDLSSGQQLLVMRGFNAAFLDGNNLYADFPAFQQTGRAIGKVDLLTKGGGPIVPLSDSAIKLYDAYLVSGKPNKPNGNLVENRTLLVQDARDGKPLWSRSFPKMAPKFSVTEDDDRISLVWMPQNEATRDEIKKYPFVAKQFDAMNEHNGVYLITVLEARTGMSVGAALVDTGLDSFRIEHVNSTGDWLSISDDLNRTSIYSIKDGKLVGSVFGSESLLSPALGLLATGNDTQLQVYSLPELEKRSRVSFTSPISKARFAGDGKSLFVLTDDQQFYIFDSTALAQSAPDPLSNQGK